MILARSIAIEVFEAWMPKQAYMEVFMAASMAVDLAESRLASEGAVLVNLRQ